MTKGRSWSRGKMVASENQNQEYSQALRPLLEATTSILDHNLEEPKTLPVGPGNIILTKNRQRKHSRTIRKCMGLIIIINLHVSAPGSFVVVTAKENQHLWHHHQIKTFRDYSCGLSLECLSPSFSRPDSCAR